MKDLFLPGLPVDKIVACYEAAPGDELKTKFKSAESSAALAANAFGLFLDPAYRLPPLPHCEFFGIPMAPVALAATVRFPWRGGRHPWLDALVETESALIGIESKRFEPFRAAKPPSLSEAYRRPVWGAAMTAFEGTCERLRSRQLQFAQLDAAQLVKHAFGLRSEVHRDGRRKGKTPVLLYLYAEPRKWPDGRVIAPEAHARHREEIARFADAVAGDEVLIRSCSYGDLLDGWRASGKERLRAHADAVEERFRPR
ncbi:MAG: hypothetical protein WD270_06800 [Acetobacterales bacterium]